ncbi:hypothetical protein RBWH47_01628 [Rhodopirellula baltica WH47]|uniref:Uncharacterized protein n=1 Tax=Rhodopirellula baltica WH47 TaxID=991778 RepID=F2AW55_RHOBT|nr:hypothetical protein RBWH47_01628 [Rhodopirellula baltica WH47]
MPAGALNVGQEWPTYQQNQRAVASRITWAALLTRRVVTLHHPPRPEPPPNETLG